MITKEQILRFYRLTKEEYQKLIYSGEIYVEFPSMMPSDWQSIIPKEIQDIYYTFHLNYNELKDFYDEFHIKAIMNLGFNDKQAEKIAYKAWEDGHSAGYSEILLHLVEICDFLIEIQKAGL